MKKQLIVLGKLDHAEDEHAAHEHVTNRKGIGNYDGDLRCATSHEQPHMFTFETKKGLELDLVFGLKTLSNENRGFVYFFTKRDIYIHI